MRTIVPLTAVAIALACSLASVPAHARTRVFVASYGDDANPCTFGSPCKTFQHAHDVVDAGGEVTAIDSAGFGPINITKAVSITSPSGVEAGIVPVPNNDAVIINAGSTDTVALRGLTIIGSGTFPGSHGITFTSGGTFNIQDCVVRGFANAGINLDPTGSTNFTFSDLVLANNGTNGISVAPTGTGTTTRIYLERVVSSGNFGQMNNGTGFAINGSFSTGTINVTIVDSVAHSNSTGFFIQSASAHATTNVTLVNVKASNNDTGIKVNGTGATAFLRHSTISGNPSDGYAVTSGGVLKSFSDNAIVDTTNLGSIAQLSLQ
jgi:hypothetical protein